MVCVPALLSASTVRILQCLAMWRRISFMTHNIRVFLWIGIVIPRNVKKHVLMLTDDP